MAKKVKVQVYLEAGEAKTLRYRAEANHSSMAAMAREAIAEYVAKPHGAGTPMDDPIWDIVGIIDSPHKDDDGSLNADHYVYGTPKKKVADPKRR